jgi:hypothetical protein
LTSIRRPRRPEAELKEARARQLEYLKASNESLEDALKRRSTIGMAEASNELVISLGKLKAGLLDITTRKTPPSGLRRIQANRVDRIC